MSLRLLSWNVRDLLGDPLAVARVITDAAPDVVCLQEAPRWPGSRLRLAAMARTCGMLVVGGGRSGAGTAVLAGLRAAAGPAREVLLPVRRLRTRPRGFVVAELRPSGMAPVTVASIHLGLTEEERARHSRLIVDLLRGTPRLIVAGDLNEPPGGPSWATLRDLVHDTAGPDAPVTYPAAAPSVRLDAVLAGSDLRIADPGWVPDTGDVLLATDHRPVLRLVD